MSAPDGLTSVHFWVTQNGSVIRVEYSAECRSARCVGRLEASAQPARRERDQQAVCLLTLTTRLPINSHMEPAGVFDVLDVGHTWIVRGFADMTTPEMQKYWGRE